MTEQPPVVAYTWVAKPLADAAELAGVSLATLRDAIDRGDLIAHYAGRRNSKPLVRAVDLDAWVAHLPTEGSRRR